MKKNMEVLELNSIISDITYQLNGGVATIKEISKSKVTERKIAWKREKQMSTDGGIFT